MEERRALLRLFGSMKCLLSVVKHDVDIDLRKDAGPFRYKYGVRRQHKNSRDFE